MNHAQGNFTVDVHPLSPAPAEGIGRFSINKAIHGDLEATSIGEMFTAGDPKKGLAGYVAIEFVTGTIGGKSGGFALQHFATMDGKGPNMQVIVVPGSGTGELAGIEGTFTIRIENREHFYEFEYALPE
jgi:predicted membrane-bound spermidine synthase